MNINVPSSFYVNAMFYNNDNLNFVDCVWYENPRTITLKLLRVNFPDLISIDHEKFLCLVLFKSCTNQPQISKVF